MKNKTVLNVVAEILDKRGKGFKVGRVNKQGNPAVPECDIMFLKFANVPKSKTVTFYVTKDELRDIACVCLMGATL